MIEGQCYCGGVKFEVADPKVKEDVLFGGYCFCLDCRRAHAAPAYQVCYVKKHLLKFVAGEDLINYFQKEEGNGPVRSFCSRCGSRISIELRSALPGAVGIFPALFDDEAQRNLPDSFRPTGVRDRASCMLDNNILKIGEV